MSVVIETTIGDLTIDLFTEERPKTCMNFLKLCKMKYYNLNLLFSVERNFIAQTGDPKANGRGGASVFQNMFGDQARFYEGEKLPIIKHNKLGMVSMVSCGSHLFGSQFFITLGENLDSLDGEHLVFGEVVEGMEVVNKLNQTLTDDDNRPYQDIRISHTVVLSDPYPDPSSLEFPDESPKPTRDILESDYIAADENIDDTEGKSMEEIQEEIAEREAKARATILEMVGDLPDSDMAPPENVLFVCKLNPVTTSDDLEIIFSRFGKINTCEVIRDRITDNSLQYAFIEFAETKSCEDAYFKMDNVLIDDRRIHVDFSQSVSKIKWRGKGKGVEYFDESGRKVDGKKGQAYDPNKEYDRQNNRNWNSNRGRGGWGNNFRPSNGGPRQQQQQQQQQQQHYRDFNKPWERDRRYQQQWGRNGGFNRNPRDNNRDRERYEGGRPFLQDEREDRNERYGRKYEGRRNDREEDRNNKNKGKDDARKNDRDVRHDDRYEGRKGEGDARHYYEEKSDRHLDKYEHKRNEKESRSNEERDERSVEKYETKRLEKDSNRYREEEEDKASNWRDGKKEREGEDRNGRSMERQDEEVSEREGGVTYKRKHSGSEDDSDDDVPSDDETTEKLLQHLKKSLKKKKKKKHKRHESESDSDTEEEEKEKKKKKKKRKKKKKVSSDDSDDSDSDVEVKKKNKKSKKKKKASSDSDDSESNSKRKSKKSKKKKKKKKKVLTSDSSD